MFYAYVIRNQKGLLYKGSTDDLSKRIAQHNVGISGFTRNKGPWRLAYHETFNTREEAENREKFFKTGRGREYLKSKLNNTTRGRAIGSSQGS